MRNRLLVGAALLAALSAGCKRAPEPAEDAPGPAGGAVLTTPVTTVISPLEGMTTGYTNDQQLVNLQNEAGKMGIRRLTRPSDQSQQEERPAISYEDGLARTREYSAALENQRHAIDREKESKTATLPNSTPGMIPKSRGGAPIAGGDPKDPQ